MRDLFKVNTMQRRMRTAFLSIILLLLFSGLMSLFELERVSHDTEEILLASKSNVEIAGEMISALNEQNDAMIYMAVVGDEAEKHRINCLSSIERLGSATATARERLKQSESTSLADSLLYHTTQINTLAEDYLDKRVHMHILEQLQQDSLSMMNTQVWYAETYKTQYLNLSRQITKYMTGMNSTLGPEVNHLSHTARRAVTPVFISLIVMMVVIVMFYYFMQGYFINPVLRINRSLQDYITYKMPFDQTISSRDELRTLRDNIAALIKKLQ